MSNQIFILWIWGKRLKYSTVNNVNKQLQYTVCVH